MKNIYKSICLGTLLMNVFIHQTSGQCANTSSLTTVFLNNTGVVMTISSCSFAGQYSSIAGTCAGQTLGFGSSVSTDFITIRAFSPKGPVLAFGQTPLTLALANYAGIISVHWNTDASCGIQNVCRTTTVQCLSCANPCANDTLPPVISGVGPDDTITCPDLPLFSSPFASDFCVTPLLTFTRMDMPYCPGSYRAVGTWAATDGAGNSTTATQSIHVIDNIPPMITVPPDISACSPGAVNIGNATATDDCGIVSITNNAPDSFPVGVTIVTWSAIDECGNVASDTQKIMVTEPLAVKITVTNPVTADDRIYSGYPPAECVELEAIVTGGVAPHSYLWSTGETIASIKKCASDFPIFQDGLASIGIDVTDGNGCLVKEKGGIVISVVSCPPPPKRCVYTVVSAGGGGCPAALALPSLGDRVCISTYVCESAENCNKWVGLQKVGGRTDCLIIFGEVELSPAIECASCPGTAILFAGLGGGLYSGIGNIWRGYKR